MFLNQSIGGFGFYRPFYYPYYGGGLCYPGWGGCGWGGYPYYL